MSATAQGTATPSADHHADKEEYLHNQQNHHGGDHDPFRAIASAQGRSSSPRVGITDG